MLREALRKERGRGGEGGRVGEGCEESFRFRSVYGRVQDDFVVCGKGSLVFKGDFLRVQRVVCGGVKDDLYLCFTKINDLRSLPTFNHCNLQHPTGNSCDLQPRIFHIKEKKIC